MKNTIKNTAWIDLLLLRLDALRLPAWIFYLALLLTIGLMDLFGFGPNSEYSLYDHFFAAFVTVWFLALIHILQRLANSTFTQFSPSFAVSKSKIENYRQSFLFAPAWIGWLTLALGLSTFGTQLSAGLQVGFLETANVPILVLIAGFLAFVGTSALTLYFMINSVRRLLLIISFHKQIKQVDIFNLESLRAFSRYTSTTSIAILLTILVNQPFIVDTEGIIFFAIFILVGVAVFITPLIGLRNLITIERDQQLTEIMSDITNISKKVRQAIRNNEEDRLGKLKNGTDVLLTQRDELAKIKTWPWKSGTIRGFSTAFLLPIFLWLVTRILERFF